MNAILKKYELDISNIDLDKSYHVDFDINDNFFKAFETPYIDHGKGKVEIEYFKNNFLIEVNFNIHCIVELICDRSLKEFDYEVDVRNRIFFKFSDKNEDLDDETVLIKHGTNLINLSQTIYDLIGIAIPTKKIHPDLITESDDSDDDILVYSSVSDVEESTDNNIDILDPRWEALKKLKK